MNKSMIMKIKYLLPALSIFAGTILNANSVFGNTGIEIPIQHRYKTLTPILSNNDSIPFSTVILYRPDNQLSREYKISTNINGAFKMKRKEAIKLYAKSYTFLINVDAAGHRKESYTFNLIQNKTHYFRIQDRNNYSGFRPFLEVIEVTEETFRREQL